MKNLLKRSFLLPVMLLLVALYLYSLWQREADIDDAWIGEHAYWLATEGHARSELMRGVTMQEEYLVVHHKLLTLHGAAFIKLFGFSLPALKSVSLVYFLLFLALFVCFFRKEKKNRPANTWFGLILLFSFPWVFKYSFVFRPEIMVMTLTFAGWLMLEKALHSARKAWLPSLLAGVLAGLCFATHLNGVIVAVAGFIFLLAYKRFIPAILFGLGALAGTLPYFYDLNSAYGWELWWYQLSQSPALDSLPEVHPLLQPLVNLLNEHKRFFHDPKIAFFSLFMIYSIIFGFKWLKRHRQPMLLYTLLLALLLGLTAMHKSRQYLLVYFPFLVIMISDVYLNYFNVERNKELQTGWRSRKASGIMLVVLLLIFIATGFYYNLVYSLNKFSPKENSRIVREYITETPSKLNIVAPMTFIFNEIENFNRIQSEVCYVEMQKADPSIHGNGFLERTKSFDIRYIILSDFYRKRLGWDDPWKTDLPTDFEIISKKDDKYLIIRRR
jgi:hypothetical protein